MFTRASIKTMVLASVLMVGGLLTTGITEGFAAGPGSGRGGAPHHGGPAVHGGAYGHVGPYGGGSGTTEVPRTGTIMDRGGTAGAGTGHTRTAGAMDPRILFPTPLPTRITGLTPSISSRDMASDRGMPETGSKRAWRPGAKGIASIL